jgi:uncharacterized protein (TIGR02246 family)
MAARKLQDVHRLWEEAFNAGDLESLSALYESDARIVPRPGEQAVVGIQAVRSVLEGFLAPKSKIRIETQSVIEAGEIALLRSQWRLTGRSPAGKPIEMSHRSTEVVRRQPDGTWRYLIDHPFGAD